MSSISTSRQVWGVDQVKMQIEELVTKWFAMAMGNWETILKNNELDNYLVEDHKPMDTRFDIQL